MAAALLVACGSDVTTGSGAGGGGGGQGGGGKGGGTEGCSDTAPCEEGVCIYPLGGCEAGATGSCELGFSCDGPPSGPLCLCDGTVLEGEYAECDAWSQSLPFDDDPTACAVGTFACGNLDCVNHVEICLETIPGAGGPATYECVPLADAQGFCTYGIADCSCLDQMALGCPDTSSCCSSDANAQETVTVTLP